MYVYIDMYTYIYIYLHIYIYIYIYTHVYTCWGLCRDPQIERILENETCVQATFESSKKSRKRSMLVAPN